ncbi:MAG: TlpA family protein disulfide reductase [Spirochaetales bacterium]|nr:TlpA family protein disulfide reductase [Spirochaetales bacterium]
MQNYIIVGGLRLPWYLIAFLSAYLIGSFILKRVTDPEDGRGTWAEKHILNSLLIGLLLWKISPLLFNFSTVSSNPQALLFLPGGGGGVFLGVIGAGSYYGLMIYRKKDKIKDYLKTSGIYLLIIAGIAGGVLLLLLIFGQFIPGSSTSKSPEAERAYQTVEIGPGIKVPDFQLTSLAGEDYAIGDLQGKWVILNFWATWCPPCKAELPELKAFYNTMDPAKTVLLGIDLIRSEKNPENLEAFIHEEKIAFPILPDTTGKVADLFRIESIPTTFVIDPEGIIREVRTGAVTRQWLESQIKQPAP